MPQESYLKADIILSELNSLVAPSKSLILTNEGEWIFAQDDKNPNRFTRIHVKINSRHKTDLNLAETKEVFEGRPIVIDGALLLEGILEGEE